MLRFRTNKKAKKTATVDIQQLHKAVNEIQLKISGIQEQLNDIEVLAIEHDKNLEDTDIELILPSQSD